MQAMARNAHKKIKIKHKNKRPFSLDQLIYEKTRLESSLF